ncbi:uncharacterized protein BDW43DRAFT_316712 [Aspergillus alliaceus]|uniref:uncharacterized protein n=1 Tax=Petromyces alliaceus TaxID=209559 RepID=UPI0012A64940|nr:uncharacterized protein BDW43DRAFT_316712 [Aspergillus alliaceus]KAB8227538.1 hypothetical protein BDW43DRAFT_316712 [Aspergillus alliaceus]
MDSAIVEQLEPQALTDRPTSPGVEEPTATGLTGPRSIALGLTRTYAADWTVPDALRELYQNWKDAILQAHPMSLVDFAPHVSATSESITIVVEEQVAPAPGGARPPARRVLGFIRFNKAQGSAEFTNLGSSLDPQCLEMGHTTKKNDERLAGGHGEGLKIAALVLSRADHHVKISASGLYWNFGFNGQAKKNFYCRLTPAKAKRDPGAPGRPSHPARLSAEVGRDVSVLVEKGQKGQRLSLNDFGVWMRDTVDLHAPSSSVRTPVGDLLLGSVHWGRLYLKGLRVPESSQGHQPFRFGYNLVHGSVDRDRQRLVDAPQAAADIHSIWERAIMQDEAKALPRYLELLRNHPSCADARGAERSVTEATAKKLWEAICREPRTRDVFYCRESDQNDDSPVIRSELKTEPQPLPDPLWSILRMYGLVRNPLEELQRRLEVSEEVDVPDTAFAHGMAHTLGALLALDLSTRRTTVVFVRCGTDSVDMAYRTEGERLYIHEKWLHVQRGHSSGTEGPIQLQREAGDAVCQHVAEELYNRAVTLIFRQTHGVHSSEALQPLLQSARRKLHEMPRMIQARTTDKGEPAKQVSFYTGHSLIFTELYGAQVQYLVALHGPHCTNQSVDLVYDARRDTCFCPRQIVSLNSRTAVFKDLGEGPWIPTIAKMPDPNSSIVPSDNHSALPSLRAQDGALVGIPVRPFSPLIGGTAREPLETQSSAPDVAISPTTVPIGYSSALHAAALPAPAALMATSWETLAGDETSLEQGARVVGALSQPIDDTPVEGPTLVHNMPMTSTDIDSILLEAPDDEQEGYPLASTADHSQQEVFNTSQRPRHRPESAPAVGTTSSDAIGDSLAIHASEAHDASSGLSLPAISQDTTGPESAWWRTWPRPPPNADAQQRATGQDIQAAKEPHQSPEQCPQFSRGAYVQVQLQVPGGDGTMATRHVLYIHDILSPAESESGLRLVATKYSFLVDQLAWEAGSPAAGSQELLLHFQDADRMGHQDDAIIVKVGDVAAVDEGPAATLVSHVTEVPDVVTGFFARYGIHEGSYRESFFVTPLVPHLSGPKGSPPFPRFTPFPVASVFDLSPDDLRLSTGFAQAGYRVSAAVGFDERCHQPWKAQHPDAVVYHGCAASAVARIDSQGLVLPDMAGGQAPRIVTINGEGPSVVSPSRTLASCAVDVVDLSQADLTPLQLCELAAQSPVLSPDFIVLTMSRSILDDQRWGSLASTMSLLLEQGYSVTLRRVPLDAPEPYRERSVLLLAAPGRTHPQWIDNAISDLQMAPTPDEVLAGHIGTVSSGSGQPCPSSSALADGSDCRGIQGAGIHAAVDPVLPAGSVPVGAASTLGLDSLSVAGPHPSGGRIRPDGARQIAAMISRIIGQFSTRNPNLQLTNTPGLVVSEYADDSPERTKRQKVGDASS